VKCEQGSEGKKEWAMLPFWGKQFPPEEIVNGKIENQSIAGKLEEAWQATLACTN